MSKNINPEILFRIAWHEKFINKDGFQKKPFGRYLQSLNPTMVQLWQGYQTINVAIDYSLKETQYCYALRYLNLYYKHSCSLLEKSFEILDVNEELTAFFYGCGPSAEIVSFLEVLKNKNLKNLKKIRIFMIDKFFEEWKYGKRLFYDYKRYELKEYFENIDIVIDSKYFPNADFSNQLYGLKDGGIDLFYFQNCLNEIGDLDDFPNRLLKNIKNYGLETSLLVITDRKGYENIDNCINKLKTEKKECVYFHSSHTTTKQSFNDIPQLLHDNIWIKQSGLWPSLKMYSTDLILKTPQNTV